VSGVSLGKLLRRPGVPGPATAARRLRAVRNTLPAALFDPKPEKAARAADGVSGHDRHQARGRVRPAREVLVQPSPVAEPVADAASSTGGREAKLANVAPPSSADPVPAPALPDARPSRPGVLSDRELYQTWLRLTMPSEPAFLVGWSAIWSACCQAGVARLGDSYYAPSVWRRLVQGAARRGDVVPFWWKAKGRPPRVITTWQHVAAWGIAGFHRRLRDRSRSATEEGLGVRQPPPSPPGTRVIRA
jgi:hypothetical protein